jgi:nucleotide-binding universal stress UspA family protein
MKINNVLIGVDDSAYAHNAVAYGFDIARKYDAAVALVHIIEPFVLPPDTNDGLIGVSMDPSMGQMQAELVNLQSEHSSTVIEGLIREFGRGLVVTKFIEFNDTGNGIINCAKQFNADLIVVGTHKRSGLDRLLSGSIAESVIRHSEIPVMVVPFEG